MNAEQLDAHTIRRFHLVGTRDGGRDYLAHVAGEIIYLDADEITGGTPDQYAYVTTTRGEEAQILLAKTDLADEPLDGKYIATDRAAELAEAINQGSGLDVAYATAHARKLGEIAARKAEEAQAAALERAQAVARVVELCGGQARGSQTRAALALGLDQSTINKLVKKAGAETYLTSTGIPAEQGTEALNEALRNLA